jgi:putative phosphoribosyl transferase
MQPTHTTTGSTIVTAREPAATEHRLLSLPYRDRAEAGRQLAAALSGHRGKGVLVLGIPRGGVPVAAVVARELDADLDIVVARKLGAPGQPELAIGAVTANGGRYLNDEYIEALGVTDGYLAAEVERKMAEAHERQAHMRGDRQPIPVAGRTVLVVDDGLATGATMRAALRSVRRGEPARLIMAAPVGSPEACREMQAEADDVLCLAQPEPFYAVGLYYQHFEPTDELEVRRLLEAAGRAPAGSPPPG